MAPVFQQLAASNNEVVFLSVDTELEANRHLARMHDVRALPTFDISVGGKPIKRIEGADVGALRAAIQEASSHAEQVLIESALRLSRVNDLASRAPPRIQTKRIPPKGYNIEIQLMGGKKSLGTITMESSATVRDLLSRIRTLLSLDSIVLTCAGRVLDEKRRGDMLLNAALVDSLVQVRIVLVEATLQINLKVGEAMTSVQFTACSTLQSLRMRARELTASAEPKLVFLGRILSDDENNKRLSELRIISGSTILCLPFGGELSQSKQIEVDRKSKLYDDGCVADVYSSECTLSDSTHLPEVGLLDAMEYLRYEGNSNSIWQRAESTFLLQRDISAFEGMRDVVSDLQCHNPQDTTLREYAMTGNCLKLADNVVRRAMNIR
jgi:hypothetical protein